MTIKISNSLSLPADAVTDTFAFLAKRGAGKSYAAMVLAEEMMDHGAQIVVLDPVSRWWGLRLDRLGTRRAYDVPVFGGPHGDVPLAPTAGKMVAHLVVTKGISVVLDLILFDSDNQRRQFVTEFCRELFRLKSQESAPTPIHVFFEEAEEFVPQSFESADSQMIGAVKKMIKLGRNFGIGTSLVSQRSASLNKNALSQTEYLLALRTKSPHDLRAVRDWIEHAGADEAKAVMAELPRLPVGTAYIFGGDIAQKIKIREKKSLDTSATPKLKKAGIKVEPAKLGEKELDKLRAAMAESVAEAEKNDPKALRRRIAELEKELAGKSKQRPAVVSVPKPIDTRALRREIGSVLTNIDKQITSVVLHLQKVNEAATILGQAVPTHRPQIEAALQRLEGEKPKTNSEALLETGHWDPIVPVKDKHRHPGVPNGDALAGLPHGARGMLHALRINGRLGWMTRHQLAIHSFISSGGTFSTYLGKLRAADLVEEADGRIRLSAEGIKALGDAINDAPPTPQEIIDTWRNKHLPAGARRMLDIIIEHRDGISRKELAEASGISSGGTFSTYLGKLRGKGLLDEVGSVVRPHHDLFLTE